MDEEIKKKVDESWKDKAREKTPQDDQPKEEQLPEVNFKFFASSLAMQAWIALGAMANPITAKTETNLTQAQFLIDSLEMLKDKTVGNLDKEEAQMLEQILYDLHMAFASKSQAGPEE